jgi:crossover junction endonuclease MUS81
MNLIIDTRERKLIELLKKNKTKLQFEVKHLDIGDIIFEEIKSKENKIVIERKTIQDLLSSIVDGRYKEQKMRLLSSNYNIMYIIEGEIADKKIYTSIVSMSLEGINVIYSATIGDTIHIISKMYKKLLKNGFKNEKNKNVNYSTVVKICKKKNMTPTVCAIAQLSQIPGVSNNTAMIIIDMYETIGNLVLQFEKLNPNMLSEIKINGKRRLGDKKSCDIYKFLFGDKNIEKKKITKKDKKEINDFLDSSGYKKKTYYKKNSNINNSEDEPMFS